MAGHAFDERPSHRPVDQTVIIGQAEIDHVADRDGVIPDERQMYLWIKAAFRHFFNNVQKHPAVQIEGLRAYGELLAYLLREIAIQRERILAGDVPDDQAFVVTGMATFHFDLRTQRSLAVGARAAQVLRGETDRDGLSLLAVALR